MSEAKNNGKIVFKYKDENLYETMFEHQIGADDCHLELYPEIDPPARNTAPETLTDANCYFVSGILGNDTTGNGSNATPYKTLVKTLYVWKSQLPTQDKIYICLKDDYLYSENIDVPYWLKDRIFSDSTDDPRIRRIERTIPTGLTDSNTKWVDVQSGNDTTGNGTEGNPYKTVDKALSTIASTAFLYVAVKVDDTNDTSEEIITWLPTSTITQTVHLFSYMITNSDKVPGKSLILKPDLNQVMKTIGGWSSRKRRSYIVSRNFNANAYEEIIYVGWANMTTPAIEKTSDFKTFSSISTITTSIMDWNTICEYYYNGHWYLLISNMNGASNLIIFYYRDDGLSTGEYTMATGTAGYPRPKFASDGDSIMLSVQHIAGNLLKLYFLKNGSDPTVNTTWEEILYEASASVYGTTLCIGDTDYIHYTEGGTYVYRYKNDTLSKIDFGISFNMLSFFKSGDKIYAQKKDSEYIYELDFNSSIASENIHIGNQIEATYYSGDYVYLVLDGGDVYRLDDKRVIKQIGNTFNINIDKYNGANQQNFKGLQINTTNVTTTDVDYFNISQIASFGKLYIEGIELQGGKVGISFIGDQSAIQHTSFYSNHIGFVKKEDDITGKPFHNFIFGDIDYQMILERNSSDDLVRGLCYNFKKVLQIIAIPSHIPSPDIYYLTVDNGGQFCDFETTIQNPNNIVITNCIVSSCGIFCKTTENMDVTIDNCIIPDGSFISGCTVNDNCKSTIPLYNDIEDLDFRLMNEKYKDKNGNYYLLSSYGLKLSGHLWSRDANNKAWDVYTYIYSDLGCYTQHGGLWGQIEGDSIVFNYAPDSMTYKFKVLKAKIERAIDGTGYKTIDKMKREWTFKWKSESSITQDQFYHMIYLYNNTDGLRMYLNPIIPNSSFLSHASLINSIDMDNIFYFQNVGEWNSSDLKSDIEAGSYGWKSGSTTFTNMVGSIKGVPNQYKDLFITIFKLPGSYPGTISLIEYRIIENDYDNIVLEDYWEITDLTNGTYHYIISNALTLFDPKVIQATQVPVFSGLNQKTLPLTSQDITIQEV